jgi:amidase
MDATDLAFAGIARQASLIASGEVGSRELVEVLLRRIDALDGRLRAFRLVFAERALTEAAQADGRRGAGESRPLLGVPIAIKDDTDIAGEVTAHGSSAYAEPAREDAEVVRRLRAAGAVIIGKTNVPELTQWPFTESAAFGVTRNPWDLSRTPGGSSGGSAAAVAAGLVGAATGSDGGGSIRIPAAWCGLFGLKPQRGRVSLAPRAQGWNGLSVNGVLTRGVADTALFLDVAAGATAVDRDRAEPPSQPFCAFAASGPGRLRVAVSTRVPPGLLARVAPELQSAVQDVAALLRSLGHDVRDAEVDYGPQIASCFVGRYLRGIHDDAASVPHPARLERRTKGMARLGGLVAPPLFERLLAAEGALRERVNGVLADHDVLLIPTTAVLAPPVGRFEARGALWTLNGVAAQVPFTGMWNLTGQPACAVPAGFTPQGLPRSVQLVGRPSDEGTLLSLAAQLEREQPAVARRPAMAQ